MRSSSTSRRTTSTTTPVPSSSASSWPGGVRSSSRATTGPSSTRSRPSSSTWIRRSRERTTFGGNYSDYLVAKADERARWERRFADEQDELKALKFAVDVTARSIAFSGRPRDNDKFAKSFKGGALDKQISRRVRNASGRLDELTGARCASRRRVLSFAGIPSGSHALGEADGLLLQVTDARIGDRLDVASFRVEPQSRILITGQQRSGQVDAARLRWPVRSPSRPGSVSRRKGLRVGMLDQDVRFADPAASPRRLFRDGVGEKRAETTPLVSLGLIAPRDLDRPVGALSSVSSVDWRSLSSWRNHRTSSCWTSRPTTSR